MNSLREPVGDPARNRLRRVSTMPCAHVVKTLRGLVVTGSSLALLGTAHQLYNQRLLRRPATDPPPVSVAVSILVPARDEAHRIAPTVRSLLAQDGLVDVEILV